MSWKLPKNLNPKWELCHLFLLIHLSNLHCKYRCYCQCYVQDTWLNVSSAIFSPCIILLHNISNNKIILKPQDFFKKTHAFVEKNSTADSSCILILPGFLKLRYFNWPCYLISNTSFIASTGGSPLLLLSKSVLPCAPQCLLYVHLCSTGSQCIQNCIKSKVSKPSSR